MVWQNVPNEDQGGKYVMYPIAVSGVLTRTIRYVPSGAFVLNVIREEEMMLDDNESL